MADDAQPGSPKNEPVAVDVKEDAETRAARRELKQSTISDSAPQGTSGTASDDDSSAVRATTPTLKAPEQSADELKEQVASPKKKRAHDQLDAEKETEENDDHSVASTDSAKDRASRLEPEKKRHRDEDSKELKEPKETTDEPAADHDDTNNDGGENESDDKKVPQTSANAFAASGFGKLSSGTSPFATLGSGGPKAFGSSSSTPPLSSFASPAVSSSSKPAAAPKLTFGSTSGASPFGAVSSSGSGFGSALGGSAFGSALGGIKPLQSFAAPGVEPLKSEKPAKPFGAPDSDSEDDGEADDESKAESDAPERAVSPEKESDEKKKFKLQKVEVNSGESGEATVLSVRAKLFHFDKDAGWKERGAGMLKINVPRSCVDFDDSGAVIPGSFDASSLDVDDADEGNQGHKVARLVMRQDQTGRVILNTVIIPTMKFEENASLKSVAILFTSFEGNPVKPVNVSIRLSTANAKTFTQEIGVIQRELQSS